MDNLDLIVVDVEPHASRGAVSDVHEQVEAIARREREEGRRVYAVVAVPGVAVSVHGARVPSVGVVGQLLAWAGVLALYLSASPRRLARRAAILLAGAVVAGLLSLPLLGTSLLFGAVLCAWLAADAL
jgi:multisubunit Na+/H+ antiporter MnhB subunit